MPVTVTSSRPPSKELNRKVNKQVWQPHDRIVIIEFCTVLIVYLHMSSQAVPSDCVGWAERWHRLRLDESFILDVQTALDRAVAQSHMALRHQFWESCFTSTPNTLVVNTSSQGHSQSTVEAEKGMMAVVALSYCDARYLVMFLHFLHLLVC